jgi:DNA-binding transcriptional MerR regulator/methylmalonyl-CoA mutase cobalamin-binding subunit
MKFVNQAQNICSIKYVAERTGLSPHLIRVWERRYQAIVPERTASNRRLFSEPDVLRLQLLKKAVDAGNNISQVARLSSDALMRLINATMTAEDPNEGDLHHRPEAYHFYDLALNCVLQLDEPGLQSALEQASVHLTKLKLINAVVVPLCKKIGELWRGGELKIINEHMATPIIRSVLWNLLNSVEVTQVSPRIVIATPLNHHHDLGALAIALIARESGWRALFFGSDLPADEIAAAVHRTKARAVALSITVCLDHLRLVGEIQKLRGHLSRDIAFFIGGQGAAMVIDHPDIDNVQHLSELESLNAALDNLLKRRH